MNKRASITLRLTVFFATASTLVLLLLGYLIGAAVEAHFVEQDMDILTGKLELARHALERVHSAQALIAIPQQLDDSLVGHAGLAVVVVAPNGETLFATSGAEFPQALLEQKVQADVLRPITWETARGAPLRGIAALVRTGIAGAPPALVAVATDISHHRHFMASFRVTLWSFVILAALLTGFLGWLAVRRGLAPLKAIRQEASGITAQRLDFRLAVDTVPLELVDLVETLNAMLTRLDNSFRQLSDFSSDLAHELRTPLSNLLTQTQVTLIRARNPDEYRNVLVSNVEEFERLSRMIADMLFLAKSDNELIVPHREPVNLADEVRAVFEFYEALAEEKKIRMSCTGSGEVSGDRMMLRRALNNLLSNAIRHTPQGGKVGVHIDDRQAISLSLVVQNSGETIAAEHLPRLFDRFYRVDPARQHDSEGAGLGLAITQAIVHAHGGSIQVSSLDGLTRFELRLPTLQASAGNDN